MSQFFEGIYLIPIQCLGSNVSSVIKADVVLMISFCFGKTFRDCFIYICIRNENNIYSIIYPFKHDGIIIIIKIIILPNNNIIKRKHENDKNDSLRTYSTRI